MARTSRSRWSSPILSFATDRVRRFRTTERGPRRRLRNLLEVVRAKPAGDLLADRGPRLVCGAEVDSAPDTGIDDLVQGLRETGEVSRLAREAAGVNVEGNLVGLEEGPHR